MNHANRGRLHIIKDGPWRLYLRTVPVGWQILGTVQQGMVIGALGLSPQGAYGQLNGSTVRMLNPRKIAGALAETSSPYSPKTPVPVPASADQTAE